MNEAGASLQAKRPGRHHLGAAPTRAAPEWERMKQEAPIILPNGPDRDDTGGGVAAIVVALDVVHVDGLGDAGDLIEVAEEIGVVDHASPVALERRMALSLRSN